MENNQTTPRLQSRLIKSATHIIAQCINDLRLCKSNQTPIYNLDFSVLAESLFAKAEPSSKPFLPGTRDVMDWVLKNHNHREYYMLAVSGAMYYEFIDQLHHILDSVISDIPRAISAANLNEILKNEVLQKSSDLIQRLSVLTEKGSNQAIIQPTQKFLGYLEKGQLHGLGDYLASPSSTNFLEIKRTFEGIVARQKELRLPKDHNVRSDADSIFHYKMDAVNICLSLYFSRNLNSKTLFVTPTAANLEFCLKDEDLVGRHFMVLLFMKNIQILSEKKHFTDPFQFLKEALIVAESLHEQLEPFLQADDIKLVPTHLINKLNSFYGDYFGLLMKTEETDVSLSRREAIEEIRDTLSNKFRTRERIDSVVSEIHSAAKLVSEQASKLGLKHLESFELSDDPILKKIKSQLHL